MKTVLDTIQDFASKIDPQTSGTVEALGVLSLDLITLDDAKKNDSQDKIKKQSKLQKVLSYLFDSDVFESVGMKQGAEMKTAIAALQHRIEGLKTKLPKEYHVYLDSIGALYQIVGKKNEAAIKDLAQIHKWLAQLQSTHESLITDKMTSLVTDLIHNILIHTVSGGASFGITTGLTVGAKAGTFFAKKYVKGLAEEQEIVNAQLIKDFNQELTGLDLQTLNLISRQEIPEIPKPLLGEYHDSETKLLETIGSVQDREKLHADIEKWTKLKVPELTGAASTSDIILNKRSISDYVHNQHDPATATSAALRFIFLIDEISKLTEAKSKIAKLESGLSEQDRSSATTAKTVLARKIILLTNEARILQDLNFSQLNSNPADNKNITTKEFEKKSALDQRAKKDNFTEIKDFKSFPQPELPESGGRNKLKEEARKDFLKSPAYRVYEKNHIQVSKFVTEGKKIIEKIKEQKDSSKVLETIITKCAELNFGCTTEIKKSAKINTGFKHQVRKEAYEGIQQELIILRNIAIEAQKGISPDMFATPSSPPKPGPATPGTHFQITDPVERKPQPKQSDLLTSGMFATKVPAKPNTVAKELTTTFHTPPGKGLS